VFAQDGKVRYELGTNNLGPLPFKDSRYFDKSDITHPKVEGF
jgi:hypothetical protein